MYEVSTSSGEKASLEFVNNELQFNGQSFNWNIEKTGKRSFLITKDNVVYNAELLEIDHATKEVRIRVDKSIFNLSLRDKMDLLLEKMGISNMATAQVNDIKAPMPGLILDIMVEIGQEVSKGDPILILEAMKMENVLKSPGDGTVTSIEVNKGNSVEKNSVLVKF